MKDRILACVNAIKKEKLDGLLVSCPINIRYLSGMRETEAYLLLTRDHGLFYFTNFIYEEEARQNQLFTVVLPSGKGIFEALAQKAAEIGLAHIGFESKYLPSKEETALKEACGPRAIDFSPTTDLLERLRAVKTPDEVKTVRKAVDITRQALEFVGQIRSSAMTEKTVYLELEKFLKVKGDISMAFEPIVACGVNSARPHHQANDTRIGDSHLLIDTGARYQGYCADLTRVFFGSKMPRLFQKTYDTILKAQESAIALIKAGIPASQVDAAARVCIEDKGWGKNFGHGTGHGIGLSVHEYPAINARSTHILEEGMIVTVEPAVYFTGKFGLRVESMILVTANKGEVLDGSINR